MELYDLAISLLGIHSNELRSNVSGRYFMFMAALFTVTNIKATQVSMRNEWISKMWHTHIEWNIIQLQKEYTQP